MAIFSVAVLAAAAALYGDAPDAKHAWAVHDKARPKPAKVEPAPYVKIPAPSDAIVLFDGTRASYEMNWCGQKGGRPGWLFENGSIVCAPGKNLDRGGIRTREEFGDCQLHIEFRHDPAKYTAKRTGQSRGNSGVFLMGTGTGHEVQILESYATCRELEGKPGLNDNYPDGQCASIYAETPPLVNPQRKIGEWQTYDIVFHQPVWEKGKLLHPGSITVFFNGVLVQDAWEMEGLTTHLRRRPLAEGKKRGPLALQDHGCWVEFRNVWYRPIPSRWDNRTHSLMSADAASVKEQRAKNAAAAFAKIANPAEVSAANLLALGAVVQYEYAGKYKDAFDKCLAAYSAKAGRSAKETANVAKALDVLVRAGVIDKSRLPK